MRYIQIKHIKTPEIIVCCCRWRP